MPLPVHLHPVHPGQPFPCYEPRRPTGKVQCPTHLSLLLSLLPQVNLTLRRTVRTNAKMRIVSHFVDIQLGRLTPDSPLPLSEWVLKPLVLRWVELWLNDPKLTQVQTPPPPLTPPKFLPFFFRLF